MSNLLIVDDELEILEWLEELFKYECTLELDVFTANSARRALELLNTTKFEVVLTDIKMPGIDGITLFETIKENWPNCKTIFLTGYSEFEYAYKVINHKDVRYILKSEGDEVIMDVVTTAFEDIKRKLEQDIITKKERLYFEKANFWLKKEFIDGIIQGKLDTTMNQSQLEELGIPLHMDTLMLIFLVRIDNFQMTQYVIKEYTVFEEFYLTLQQYFPQQLNAINHIIENKYMILMIQPKEIDESIDWEKIYTITRGALEYAQENYLKSFGYTVSISESSSPVLLQGLARKIEQLKLLMVRNIGSNTAIIVHAENSLSVYDYENDNMDVISRIPMLKSYLELRKKEDYYNLLHECCSKMLPVKSSHDAVTLELYYNISITLLQFINKNHLNQEMAFKIGLYKLTKVDEHGDWSEAGQYLYDISNAIFELLDDNEYILTDIALKRVKDYINSNLSADLTLTKLAEVGGFNSSYLSRVYKQVYGMTISEYIINKRLGKAKDLLVNKKYKINEIATQVGYISAHSFTRAFKNVEGISPIEYRELNISTK